MTKQHRVIAVRSLDKLKQCLNNGKVGYFLVDRLSTSQREVELSVVTPFVLITSDVADVFWQSCQMAMSNGYIEGRNGALV